MQTEINKYVHLALAVTPCIHGSVRVKLIDISTNFKKIT